MKKITSVLLASLTAVVMNGCDDSDTAAEITSVAINDLTLGYKVSGTGDLVHSDGIESITYCDGQMSVTYVGPYSSDYWPYYIDGYILGDEDELVVEIDTEAAGTPGTLDIGVTYNDIGRSGDGWEWTITSIEEIECPVPI